MWEESAAEGGSFVRKSRQLRTPDHLGSQAAAAVALCDRSEEIDYLLAGRFEYGTLFADTVLRDRALPHNAPVSREDVFGR
jgi:hypothetical protein